MNQSDAQYANEKLVLLKSAFLVDVIADWMEDGGAWQPGNWAKEELDQLVDTLNCFSDCIGGLENFRQLIGGATVRKSNIGTHGGEADAHQVKFALQGFSPWTTVHEFAHAWDANHGWKLSVALEKYTGGHTSLIQSWFVKFFGRPDLMNRAYDRTPGHYGRLPGCNAAGYFYGDVPGGSDWNFNRKEDFAECVAMYVGWERNNSLSQHAKDRIVRYKFKNGDKDGFGAADNWTDYARYFYPQNGDYAKTIRWQFVDELVRGKVNIQ